LTIALLTGLFPAVPRAADVAEPATSPVSGQRSFASPDEALQALKTAAATKDPAAMSELFGPDYPKLLTGDKAQDAKNAEHFAEIMAQGCEPVAEGDARITFETGTNHWPLPIPLVKADGQWRFDTAAGQEEIINRHVGKDELHAIGVCRAYVTAQRQFALTTARAGSETKYAQKFMSTTGAKDGLYWPVTENEPASPFGPVVAEAQVRSGPVGYQIEGDLRTDPVGNGLTGEHVPTDPRRPGGLADEQHEFTVAEQEPERVAGAGASGGGDPPTGQGVDVGQRRVDGARVRGEGLRRPEVVGGG